MLTHAIDHIKVNGDNIELLYSVYRGSMQDVETYNPSTEQTEIVHRFVAETKVSQETITFTRQNAYDIAMKLGANEEANELKSITMEQIRKTYNHLLDTYLRTQYEPQS